MINGIAGSYAERIPVIAVTGAPSTEAMKKGLMLHHSTGDYDTPRRMFSAVTVYDVMLKDAETAPDEIDRAIVACLSKQRPVYIGVPSDLVSAQCKKVEGKLEVIKPSSDNESLEECIDEAATMLNAASKPLIILDAEVTRYGLQKETESLINHSGLPFTVLMLGKTVVDESHPQFIGLYMGDRSRPYVQDRVNNADCVLEIGLVMSDLNTGGFTMKIDPKREIRVHYDRTKIKSHWFEKVAMKDFLVGLAAKLTKRDPSTLDIHKATDGCAHRRTEHFSPQPEKPLTAERFFLTELLILFPRMRSYWQRLVCLCLELRRY